MGVPALQSVNLLQGNILQGCEEGFVVLKKDPITNYALWARSLLYFVYWLTDYSSGIELMSVCTSKDRAEELCVDAGYRIISLPIDESLPEEKCQWKPEIHPKSPFRNLYMQYAPRLIAVDNAKLSAGLNNAENGLRKLKTILSTVED